MIAQLSADDGNHTSSRKPCARFYERTSPRQRRPDLSLNELLPIPPFATKRPESSKNTDDCQAGDENGIPRIVQYRDENCEKRKRRIE